MDVGSYAFGFMVTNYADESGCPLNTHGSGHLTLPHEDNNASVFTPIVTAHADKIKRVHQTYQI